VSLLIILEEKEQEKENVNGNAVRSIKTDDANTPAGRIRRIPMMWIYDCIESHAILPFADGC